jgi:ferric iron reductase protein FhuF
MSMNPRAEPCPSPAAALDAVVERVTYLRIATRQPDTAPADWIASAPLVHDPDALAALVRRTADGRGIERDDVAMSMFVQSYAFRVASVAIGTWLISGGCIDVSPRNISIQLGRDRPNAVLLDEAAWAVPPSAPSSSDALAALHAHLVDGHLAPLIQSGRNACRVGGRTLWSNVATACASAFGAFMGPAEPAASDRRLVVRAAAIAFFTAGSPELQAGGDVVSLGPTWAWERRACCLLYQHASSPLCDDCSLTTPADREARRRRILAEATVD